MSETTEILFNHPALHSLKRDQLVKLCKIHSIKANGKNSELVEKLKKHAETMPRDSPLSVATRSEPGGIAQVAATESNMAVDDGTAPSPQPSGSQWGFQAPRPSEQWEVVMDAIEEMIEENATDSGTMSSQHTVATECGEFGNGFSKSSSVTSSIKSIASSLGFKRGFGGSSTFSSSSSFPSSTSSTETVVEPFEPTKKAINEPISKAMTPSITSFPVSDLGEVYEPLPGQSLRAGVPAPPNARLSLGLNAKSAHPDQPTTTIRLIAKDSVKEIPQTPQLKPFKTAFELEVGSPHGSGFGGTTLWPQEEKGIYPALPLDTPLGYTMSSMTSAAVALIGGTVPMPGELDFLPNPHSPPTPECDPSLNLPNPHSEPHTPTKISRTPSPSASFTVAKPAFVFGSPLPQHNVTNDEFKDAAASVLEEMNKRLQQDGVNGVEVGILSRLRAGVHADGVDSLSSRVGGSMSGKGGPGIKAKFDKQHEAEFAKMEGIDAMVKRKVSVASTQSRRSSASVSHGAGRDRFGRRTGSSAGRVSTTSRVTSTSSKRTRVIPGAFDLEDEEDDVEEDKAYDVQTMSEVTAQNTGVSGDTLVEKKTAEEIEEEQRQKEKDAIRRKLEMNKARRRSSVAAGRVSIGKGGVLHKPQTAPKPRFGFLSSAKNLVKSVWDKGKKLTNTPKANKVAPAPSRQPVAILQRKASTATITAAKPPSRQPSSATANPPKRPVVRNVAKEPASLSSGTTAVSSLRTRTTTSSFAPSKNSSIKSEESRQSSVQPQEAGAPTEPATPVPTGVQPNVPSSVRSYSSVGSTTASRKPSSGKVSTLAARTSGGSTSSIRPRPRIASASSSRLLAPTASSLARAAATRKSMPTNSVTSPKASETGTLALVTNTAIQVSRGGGITSPRPGGIFSKPLIGPSTCISRLQARTASGSSAATGLSRNTSVTSKASTDSKRSVTRKPRISRSKVIAKLASQRAANTGVEGSSSSSGPDVSGKPKIGGTPHTSKPGARTRSSLGAQAKRSSFTGVAAGRKAAAADAVLLSAKKRFRQSEYYSRKASSKPMKSMDLGETAGSDGMEVDADE